MKPPLPSLKPLSPEALVRVEAAEYEFHVAAFGEEMARVNFLPLAQRKLYVREMQDHARRNGVAVERPADGLIH